MYNMMYNYINFEFYICAHTSNNYYEIIRYYLVKKGRRFMSEKYSYSEAA